MGLFDSLKNMFAHHEHHHGASIGQPLTLTDTKAVLAFIVLHQHLADMRKVAEAVKQLQDEMPQYITFGMSHYYSEPKRVRFQSEGGKFIDADAIATAFAETTVLQDECEIQHLMGDIEDNREHRDPAKTPAVPIDELVRVTDERLATGNDEERSRAWLFALFDQLDDIAEATKNNLEPLVTALDTTLQNSSATIGNSATTDAGSSNNNANAGDARSRIISPNRRRSLPGRRILADKRVLSIRRHPRTDAQSHRNIARLHASHRRTARPRSHYLPVSPRSQPVVHTAVVHMAVIHAAHTARNLLCTNHCVRTTRTHYFSSFSNFSSAFNSESTCPLARTL